jgi:hypothetical protein
MAVPLSVFLGVLATWRFNPFFHGLDAAEPGCEGAVANLLAFG